MKVKALIVSLVLLFLFLAKAEELDSEEKRLKITPEIYIGFQTGQYVRARYRPYNGQNQTLDHLWIGDMIGRGGFRVAPTDWLTLNVGIEARLWLNKWPTSQKLDQNGTISYNKDVYLHEAYGLFSFFNDWPNGGLELKLGQFIYKYNPDVRDLGEYLFRTGTYPLYIKSDFDFPMARITGLRVGFNFNSSAELFNQSILGSHIDGILLTEREIAPFHDFTLAFIGGVNAFKAVELGAGISFAHLLSVDDSCTTPKTITNRYVEVDTINNTNDTGYYSFKGAKLMFRASLDPVFFLRGREGFVGDFFGKEGLKLYTELAVIGWKKYPSDENNNPFGYNEISEKMPLLLGFTIPFWKILDVFAVEFEHFDCPYPNSYNQIIAHNEPLPIEIDQNDLVYNSTVYRKDNWKFCVYVKKNIGEYVGFIFQASRDHQGWETDPLNWRNRDYEEAFIKWNEWSWHFKTEYRF